MALSHHVVSQSSLSRRRLLAGGLALTGAGALAACSSGTASRAASASVAGGALTIGLTYTPNIQFAPFYMAKKDGTYAANVTLHHHGAQDGLFDALQSGQEQLVVAGADEAVVATSNGSDLVVVGGYYQSYPACLIVPENSSIKAPADLKGKTVGTPGRKGETWYALQLAMSTASLTESDLTIQDIGYTQQAALVGGKVDAVVGFSNNDAIQIRQAGTPVRTIQVADRIPLVGVSLVTTRSPAGLPSPGPRDRRQGLDQGHDRLRQGPRRGGRGHQGPHGRPQGGSDAGEARPRGRRGHRQAGQR